MPDPPQFVNYANPDAIPASSSRPTSRPAHFARSSNRTNQPRQEFIPPPEEEPNPNNNVAGVGTGRRNSVLVSDPAINGSSSLMHINGYGAGGSGQSSGPSAGDVATPQTMLKIGDQVQSVNPDHGPQPFKPGHSSGGSKVGQENDPLAKQMAELRSASAAGRRNSFVQREQQQESGPTGPTDFSGSADMVVGGYPSPSRPVSPSQPTAALMRPPPSNGTSTGVDVGAVLAGYQQSLPGERRSHSRSASRQSQIGSNQLLERPGSRDGFAGIGSQGRSPSPSFNGSRNTSPIPPQQGSISRPSATPATTPGQTARQEPVTSPQQRLPNRATTPNSVGIALDPTGRVAIDDLADAYQPQPPQHSQSSSQSSQHHAPPQNQQSSQRRLSTSHSNGSVNISGQHSHIPPQTQPPYGAPPPAPYQQQPPTQPPQPQQPHYMQPPAQQPPPVNYPQHHYQPQPGYAQPPPHPAYTQQQQGLARGQSVSGAYYQPPVQQQQPQQIINGFRSTSPQPVHNQPVQAQQHGVSAAPTGQYTENGQPVLFYGTFRMFRALLKVFSDFPYCQSRRCTIIPRRSRKSSTSNQETSSPLPRPLRMVGGAVSCWMRRGGNPGDMYSRATLFVCSDVSSLFILNSPSNTHRLHAVEVYILLSARYVLAYIYRHPFPPGLMGPSFSVTLF